MVSLQIGVKFSLQTRVRLRGIKNFFIKLLNHVGEETQFFSAIKLHIALQDFLKLVLSC